MYQSILNYYKQLQVAKTFRHLSMHAQKRAMRRDMQHNADLFIRKQALAKFLRVARSLEQQRLEAAQSQRDHWLMIKSVSAMRDNVTLCKEKREKMKSADFFSHIRLKLNVFRSLAIHTLRAEQARLARACRKTVTLRVKDRTSRQLAAYLSKSSINRVPPKSASLRTKAIQKAQRRVLFRVKSPMGCKQVKKIEIIRKAICG